MLLSPADRLRVTDAVIAAETRTDAEIVTIVAPRSDAYRDVALLWAALATLLLLIVDAARPGWRLGLHALLDGGWTIPTGQGHPWLAVAAVLVFLLVRWLAGRAWLRDRLTPAATAARRVRRRAIMLFRVGVQHHTADRTGVLLYLSLAERRAEIVADQTVHAAIAPEIWGDILADLLTDVRAGRAGDGMVAAVDAIGATLANAFPRSTRIAAQLPDRLIQL